MTESAPAGVLSTYAGIEELKERTGITGTDHDGVLWRALHAASRSVDRFCNRGFYVLRVTRRFDIERPEGFLAPGLLSVTALKEDDDGDRVFELSRSSDDYLLYPLDAQPTQPWGRPYHEVVADPQGSRPRFATGRARVELDGEWGFLKLSEATGASLDEGQPLGAADTSVTVDDGSLVEAGWTVVVESERMFVRGVSWNVLTVVRGVNGTSAVSHVDGSAVSVERYPGAVEEAALLAAARLFMRKDSPVAVTAGSYGLGLPGSHAALDPDAQRLLSPLRRLPVGAEV